MTLWFTALDKHVQFRDFSCQLTSFEVALDILSKITSQGSKLLAARIIDEGNRHELSVDAFDGEPLTGPIQQLEEQWQAILSQPVRLAKPIDNWRINLTRQQIKIFDERIAQFLLLIDKLEQFRKRVESIHDKQQKDMLIQYYNVLINTYQQHITRAQASQQVAQKKLARLQK